MKDLGGRLPLCPRNERTSSWTYKKTINTMQIMNQKAGSYTASRKFRRLHITKRTARSTVRMRKIMDHVEGSTPPKQKKKTTADTAGASHAESLAPIVGWG
jgi:hypothetical protein